MTFFGVTSAHVTVFYFVLIDHAVFHLKSYVNFHAKHHVMFLVMFLVVHHVMFLVVHHLMFLAMHHVTPQLMIHVMSDVYPHVLLKNRETALHPQMYHVFAVHVMWLPNENLAMHATIPFFLMMVN